MPNWLQSLTTKARQGHDDDRLGSCTEGLRTQASGGFFLGSGARVLSLGSRCRSASRLVVSWGLEHKHRKIRPTLAKDLHSTLLARLAAGHTKLSKSPATCVSPAPCTCFPRLAGHPPWKPRMNPAPTNPDAAASWNERYAGSDFLFGREPNAWLREHANALPAGGRILCVADGEGRNSVWLARQGFQVDAFDVADRAVAKARAWAESEGVPVNFTVADSDRFAWPVAAYDGVVAIFVQFADPELRGRMFSHMVRSLKPGGMLILQGYTPAQLVYRTGGPSCLSHLYTQELLRTSFADMSFITLREYEVTMHEGEGHKGMSALIGLLARR